MNAALLLAAGLALLVGGGDLLVRGASSAARGLGLSPLLIGLTVIGFGTSAPELATSLAAAYSDAPGIVLGNVVGSNIANALLILGVTALIAPLPLKPAAFRREGPALAASSLICLAIVLFGTAGRREGALLLLGLAGYLAWAYRTDSATPAPGDAPSRAGIARSLLLAAIGIAGTIGGARLFVDGAVVIARHWGASDALIGLTVVAIGTSLPELVACSAAAIRREPGLALGNVIGSNIFNVLGILGLTATIRPVPVPEEIARFDIWVLLAATALLLLLLRTGWRIRRLEGAVLLAGYAAYLAAITLGA